jgi:hypothetical protein
MIKFFRKIRQNLLTENKFSKYFLYAIGEILLVVIGILIALQIGDLNEERKKNEEGITQKNSLVAELGADLEILKLDLEYLTKELEINNSYTKRLADENSSVDTLVKIVRHEYLGSLTNFKKLNKTTFNALEATNKIELLGKNLAKNVQKYYTNRDTDIETISTNKHIYFNLLEPFMLKYPGYWFSIQGHLQDLYWENADKITLYGAFNGLITVRLFSLNVRKGIVEQLIGKTEKLIDELE